MVIVQCPVTKAYVGHIPGWGGAYIEASTIAELKLMMKEVAEMLLEEGELNITEDVVGIETISVEVPAPAGKTAPLKFEKGRACCV